ncbi:FTR1 family protein [soil metagenome]
MLANFLIGLREGLEASLIVSILIAYLVKTGRRDQLRFVWLGVGIAVAISIAAGAMLQFTSRNMTFEQQELLGGTLSIIAVIFVTWMVFWMRKVSRNLKGELEGQVDNALALGPLALVLVSLLAVGREGLETSLFIWAASQSTTGPNPLVAALLGIATAVLLGYLIYRGAISINLKKFFTITGALLIVVAAGVLAYGIHDLQEANFLPGLTNKAFDITNPDAAAWSLRNPSGWMSTLAKGTFNFQPDPTVLQVVAWFAYLVPTMAFFFAPMKSRQPVKV